MTGKTKRPVQTRMKGGNPIQDVGAKDSPEKDLFEFGRKKEKEFSEKIADEELQELMEMKRSELMDEVMDKIGSFSTMELIKLVVMARTGELEE